LEYEEEVSEEAVAEAPELEQETQSVEPETESTEEPVT
ncbi:MAG: hypothetical protein RLZZ69_1136, partial [Cyanobacteriota bacterium]